MSFLVNIAFVLMIILVAISVFNYIGEKGIDVKAAMDSISTPVSWLGVFLTVIGVFLLVKLLINLGAIERDFIRFVCLATMVVTTIALGMLSGVSAIKPFVTSEQAVQKIDAIVSKVASFRAIIAFAFLAAFGATILQKSPYAILLS